MKRISHKTRILISVFTIGVVTALAFTNCAKNGFDGAEPERTGLDPFLEMAWHIRNTAQKVFAEESAQPGVDLNLFQTWTSGLSGKGVSILISDDGVEDTHEDLKANFLYTNVSKDYTLPAPYTSNTSPPKTVDDNHGTAVAGLIAAVASNGVGTKGVAYKAGIAATNFLSTAASYSESILLTQATGNFDIFNMSWGAKQNGFNPPVSSFLLQIRNQALMGRSSKGAIFVKAAGNDFFVECHGTDSEDPDYCVGNSNFDSDNTTPYTINVSALNSLGHVSSYSSPGSNIWISSFGGEFGYDSPAMITTDRMGCTKGFATYTADTTVAFEKGGNGNDACSYSAVFNGTSSAAPVLSGVVALLLEANPNLTWRDVKYILAKTATPVNYSTGGSISHPLADVPLGYKWEQTWVVNGAGFKFHNWYGFGRVNVDAAVALAKSYTSPFGTFTETAWSNERTGLNLSIPDNSATGVSDAMSVSTNIKIEAVQLKVWITHPNIAELALELTSPSGIKSIVINLNNSLQNIANFDGEIFLTNAFYQESSQGVWTLKVIDGKSTKTGTVTGWSLNFVGSN